MNMPSRLLRSCEEDICETGLEDLPHPITARHQGRTTDCRRTTYLCGWNHGRGTAVHPRRTGTRRLHTGHTPWMLGGCLHTDRTAVTETTGPTYPHLEKRTQGKCRFPETRAGTRGIASKIRCTTRTNGWIRGRRITMI